MAFDDERRLELYLELRKAMGDNLANMLMENLPPSDWSDVARQDDLILVKSDVSRLGTEIDQLKLDVTRLKDDVVELKIEIHSQRIELSQFKDEFRSFRDENNRRIDAIEKRLNMVITVGVGFGLSLLALQVQIVGLRAAGHHDRAALLLGDAVGAVVLAAQGAGVGRRPQRRQRPARRALRDQAGDRRHRRL